MLMRNYKSSLHFIMDLNGSPYDYMIHTSRASLITSFQPPLVNNVHWYPVPSPVMLGRGQKMKLIVCTAESWCD